jgi:hypothetical protein
MVIASSKNSEMPQNNIYLPEKHPFTLDQLEFGPFYPVNYSSTVEVPHGYAPVLCEYTGDWSPEGHAWTNPISGQIYTKHPLNFPMGGSSFYETLYEVTKIEGLTFGEGEAWDPDTNEKVRIEKIVPTSVWNPFFQRYDPPCNCDPQRIEYDYVNDSFHIYFLGNQKDMFFNIYCTCCRCDDCKSIHIGSCIESCRL